MKKRASPARVASLVAEERQNFDLRFDGKTYWFTDKRNKTGLGAHTELERDTALEIRIGFNVLEQLGIEDAYDYDWHLWCNDGAEQMVNEIIQHDV